MGGGVVVLGACCAGKTSLRSVLPGVVGPDHVVLESDEEVMRAAGGVWPADEMEVRRLVVEAAARGLAMERVVYLTSWMPAELLESARTPPMATVLLDVPRSELERRNRQRMMAGGHGDMSHWFDLQLGIYADFVGRGLVDVVLDGTWPIEELATEIAALAAR